MSLALGCVAENTPKYLGQALRLVQSIRWFGGALNEAELYVCVVDDISPDYRKELESYGAMIRIVPRFSAKHPQSNKLRFLELPDLARNNQVLLLDCDTIVVRDPLPHLFHSDFTAKIADVSTVPLDIFRRLFAAFDTPMPKATQRCTVSNESTIPYFNAGVLAFSRRAMDTLVPKWVELNQQLIDRMELLEERKNFCEQASLSLALATTRIPFEAVGNAFNFPMHFDASARAPGLADIDPFIVHYHWLADPSDYILPSSYPAVNRRIDEFNARLRKERESWFDNRLFWNQRYAENPVLGSGVGSRGEARDYKRQLLREAVTRWQPRSILDVGCGDLEVGSALPAEGYTGLDFSEVVVAANREKYPDRAFLAGNFLEMETVVADMVVCLDVLIHLASPDDYRNFIHKLLRSTNKAGIVAGDETDPELAGIVFFHEPLSRTLANAGARNIRKIGCYRHVTVFEFNPPAAADQQAVLPHHAPVLEDLGHPRDISPNSLNEALQKTKHPDLLRTLVDLSRAYLGFFTSHLPRSLEYPWLLHRLAGLPPANMLDIGAGVSPVPLFLAKAGHAVTTADHHTIVRTYATRSDWNEWGFLDYGQLHPGITSRHRPVETMVAWRKFDVVYSISVLEHMPKTIRRQVIERASLWLKPGGRLLLTLDLAPKTNDLWNRSEGNIVDKQGHGTVMDVLKELASSGFHVDGIDYFREIPDSSVDVVCIEATLKTSWLVQVGKVLSWGEYK